MKTLMKLCSMLFLMLTLTSNSYAQTCNNQNIVHLYAGVRNTQELAYLFNTSTNALITALTCSTKNSIETYLDFRNGLPIGMNGADTCITRIEADTSYCRQLFEVIFSDVVIVCTSSTYPTVTNITYAQFKTKIGSGGGGTCGVFEEPTTLCTNCCEPPFNPNPQDQVCCTTTCTNPTNCLDQIVQIGANYYHITP